MTLDERAIVAAEALLRWPHPRYGLISAATFVPIAERSGLAVALGAHALARACREAARWPALASRPVPKISVNVSARQLKDDILIDQIARALEDSGLDPERLEIEVAESVTREPDHDLLLNLAAIRDDGVGLVLDNFGAEVASLVVLGRLPLTAVKLARSFVRAVPEEIPVVGAAIAAAHGFGLTVIAQGIESEKEREGLALLGCDEGQGYLFGRPEPPEALGTRLSFPAGT